MFQKKSISTHSQLRPSLASTMDDHQLVTPTMTEDTGEQKRPAQESDDTVVRKRKRQVKIKFIQN